MGCLGRLSRTGTRNSLERSGEHCKRWRKPEPDIAVGDMVLGSNESQLQHLPKGRQKLAIKLVGPYKVTKVDKSKSNYTLDIPDSRRHNTFYVSYLQKYQDPHLELFPNRQRRQPRISPVEQDLNIEIEKLIGQSDSEMMLSGSYASGTDIRRRCDLPRR